MKYFLTLVCLACFLQVEAQKSSSKQWPVAFSTGTSLSHLTKRGDDYTSKINSSETDLRVHLNHNHLGLAYIYVSWIYSQTETNLLDVRIPDAPTTLNTTSSQLDCGIGFTTTWWSYRELPRLFPAVDGWISFTRNPKCNFNALLGYTNKQRWLLVAAGFTMQGTGAGPIGRISFLIGAKKKRRY